MSDEESRERKLLDQFNKLPEAEKKKLEDELKKTMEGFKNTVNETMSGAMDAIRSFKETIEANNQSISQALSNSLAVGFSSIKESFERIGKYTEENKEIFDKIEDWPEMTGLSEDELDEMAVWEVVDLIKQKGFLPNGTTKKKKSGQNKRDIEAKFLCDVLSNDKYFTVPSTSLTNVTKQILHSPNRVKGTRSGQIKMEKHYLTKDVLITYKGNDSTFTFSIDQTKQLFTKRITNGAKALNFFLQKLNEQNYREKTTFLMSEIVNIGIYANKKSGYKGIKAIVDSMSEISIEAITTIYNGNKREEIRSVKAKLIAQYDISANECHVVFPPIFREGMRYITILPSWSYSLNENAYMLLDYIFYLARQRAPKIKKDGYFEINLDTIRIHLGLKTPKEAGEHPQQLISEPMEKAIEEIEDAIKKAGINAGIKITPFYEHNYKHISEYLNGRIQIELDEYTQKYMEERALAQEEEFKKVKKAKQKAIEATAKKELEKAAKTNS